MSEYQYYEFLAVDRPLTTQEMAALRERSSRAHITPVSFSNSYNWGDLKGDPRDWMKRYFDLHVYVANWRTAIFMLRLSRREEKEREEAAAERRKKREEYLASLAKGFPRAWQTVHGCVERGSGLGYDEACSLLADLAEAYGRYASRATFDQELRGFMANHLRRKALVQRLEKAGLWGGADGG